ncbi:MAG: PaaI family thioesterase [Burkholderiaceae bacterium]
MPRIPEPFKPLQLSPNPFIDDVGPLYGAMIDGRFVMGFQVEERHCNPAGNCHGGMLMTLADMVLLIGANFGAGVNRFLVTVSLATDFLAPAPVGSWLEGGWTFCGSLGA